MRRTVLILAAMAVVVSGAAVPAAADTLTGVLVDSACYATLGSRAAGSDHMKCAMTCAQKKAAVWRSSPRRGSCMVTGAYTQNNNAKLIQLMNQSIVLTGTVGTRVLTSAVPTLSTSKDDARRPTGELDGVVSGASVRKGDYRDGDVALVTENIIEAISVALATTK